MLNSIYDQNEPHLLIDQNEVNKFYRQRQLIKNKMVNNFNIKKDDNESQPPFINLFRRKSLANKLKEDSGVFNSLDDSLEIDKQIMPDVSMNQSSLSRLNQSLQTLNVMKDRSHQSLTKKFNAFQAPHETLQINDSSYLTLQPTQRQIKKRSNSVQFQNSSYSLRNQSRKSLQNLKPLKQTVPLSSILRKYQQEVSKIQCQGINLDEDKKIFRQTKKSLIFKDELKTQSFNDSITYQKTVQEDNIPGGQQNQSLNSPIKLPEVVQQCIDKWKKLEIQHMKAEMKQSKENIEDFHKTQKVISNKNEKDLIEKIKLQYEQKLKQQQEKIQLLEKQNCQFKKFATSIQKMKQTLEKVESQDMKIQRRVDIDRGQYESDLNLKQLWRWIKTLPNLKNFNKDKKSSIR